MLQTEIENTDVPELSHCMVTDLTDAQQRQIQLDSCDSLQCDPVVSIARPMCGTLPEFPVVPV